MSAIGTELDFGNLIIEYMKQTILKLEEEIKKSNAMSEGVTWYNTMEDNKIINQIEDFLILHNAQLQNILNELQLLNGEIVKREKDCEYINSCSVNTSHICCTDKCGDYKKQF